MTLAIAILAAMLVLAVPAIWLTRWLATIFGQEGGQ